MIRFPGTVFIAALHAIPSPTPFGWFLIAFCAPVASVVIAGAALLVQAIA
jgi:hypothetical protein